jgi:hypothetical protein
MTFTNFQPKATLLIRIGRTTKIILANTTAGVVITAGILTSTTARRSTSSQTVFAPTAASRTAKASHAWLKTTMVENSFHRHVWYADSGDVFRCNIVWTEYHPANIHRSPWGAEMDFKLMRESVATTNSPAVRPQQQSVRDS